MTTVEAAADREVRYGQPSLAHALTRVSGDIQRTGERYGLSQEYSHLITKTTVSLNQQKLIFISR